MLTVYCAQMLDIVKQSGEQARIEQAEKRLALITPIAKGFLSELAQEAAGLGVQVFGGHGYICEWGMEQIIRDARVATIYEGTTGIQGLDLLGRKVLGSGGELLSLQIEEMREFAQQYDDNTVVKPYIDVLNVKIEEWLLLTQELGARAADANEINAAGVDYLMFSGYVLLAYFWARSVQVAQAAVDKGSDDDFYHAKLKTANFYFERILPRTLAHAQAARSGAATVMTMSDEEFLC